MKQYRVAVVGAPSMLGQEFLKILEQRNFPVEDIHLYAAEVPAGKKLFFKHREVPVAETTHECLPAWTWLSSPGMSTQAAILCLPRSGQELWWWIAPMPGVWKAMRRWLCRR